MQKRHRNKTFSGKKLLRRFFLAHDRRIRKPQFAKGHGDPSPKKRQIAKSYKNISRVRQSDREKERKRDDNTPRASH